MSWGSTAEFLHMGGYAFYVWGAYAVTLGLLAIESATLISRERNAVRRLTRELERGAMKPRGKTR
jgi:heme exporter protein D